MTYLTNMKREHIMIARAIKKQWELTVKQYGKGQESFAIHNTATRIIDALQRFDRNITSVNREEFLERCGITNI